MRDFHKNFIASTGLSEAMLASVGSTAILAAHIESWVERVIWDIGTPPKKDAIPKTDRMRISALIDELCCLGASTNPQLSQIINLWCETAKPLFHCRNVIFHGITFSFGHGATFSKDVVWGGVKRKHSTTDFHATENTLLLLQEAFGICLASINLIKTAVSSKLPLGNTQRFTEDLQRAYSIANELNDISRQDNQWPLTTTSNVNRGFR